MDTFRTRARALSISDSQKIEIGRKKCYKAVEDMGGSISSTQLRLLMNVIDATGCASVYKCLA